MAAGAFVAHQHAAALRRSHDDGFGPVLADGLAGAAAERQGRHKGNQSNCHVLTLRASIIEKMTGTCLDQKCVPRVVP
jgi:hypothetical protein